MTSPRDLGKQDYFDDTHGSGDDAGIRTGVDDPADVELFRTSAHGRNFTQQSLLFHPIAESGSDRKCLWVANIPAYFRGCVDNVAPCFFHLPLLSGGYGRTASHTISAIVPTAGRI